MATQPVIDTSPDIVGQIILLRPGQIDASDRLRPIDPVWAAALAGVMQAEGQHTPIQVCRLPGHSDYRLVAGGHRHAAAALHDMYLRCEVVTSDAVERKLREVAENLHRRDLAPMDRAAFVAELVACHKARAGLDLDQDGRAASANARWQKALQNEAVDAKVTMTFVYGWTDAAADQLGFSAATVKRDLYLYRRITPDTVEKLRQADHPILRNAGQLRALAKLNVLDQRAAAIALRAGAATVAAAIGKTPTKSSPDQARLNAFLGAFGRMSQAERKGALRLLSDLLPAGWSVGDGA